jgi:hypothetical protein
MTARKPVPADGAEAVPGDYRDAEALKAELLADVNAELQRIAEAEAEARHDIGVKQAKYTEELHAWELESARQRAAFRPDPERPERPSTAQEHALLQRLFDARESLLTKRERILGERKLQIETAWDIARQGMAPDLQEALETLQTHLHRVMPWQALVRESRLSHERIMTGGGTVRNGESDRTAKHLTIQDVLDLAAGKDPLAPKPLPVPSVTEKTAEKAYESGEAAEMRRVAQQASNWEQQAKLPLREQGLGNQLRDLSTGRSLRWS